LYRHGKGTAAAAAAAKHATNRWRLFMASIWHPQRKAAAMMKGTDGDCIIGAHSKSQSERSPRCFRYSLNVVWLFIITDRQTEKQTDRKTD
jgi:hypothetical protein